MLAVLAATIGLSFQEPLLKSITLLDAKGKPSSMMLVPDERLKTPKRSPKLFGEPPRPFEFDWGVAGYGLVEGQQVIRFELYSQEHKEENDRAPRVVRMLNRLWEYNYHSLKLDHALETNQIVSVFLCWGGRAGGEQLFDLDNQTVPPHKVNSVYLYDLGSFTEPIEMAREVAHEYGHATLPAIGGFTAPEDWANGLLGEKVFLKALSQGMDAGYLSSEDTLGASRADLHRWLAQNVTPLVKKVAQQGPDAKLMAGTSEASMNAYLGLASFMSTLYPAEVFSRSMQLTGSVKATDYLPAIELAVAEPPSLTLNVPLELKGSPLWIPLGKGKVTGATVLARKGAWAKLSAAKGPIKIFQTREVASIEPLGCETSR